MRSFIVIAGIAVLSIGCGGGGGKSGGAGASGMTPQQPLVSTSIDYNGGTLTVNNSTSPYDRTSVDIPVGALTQPTTITVSEAQTSATPTGTLPVVLEPSGTIFAVPVTLNLPFATQLVQTGDDQNDLIVLSTSAGQDAEIDPAPQVGTSRLVSTTTTHFSIFEVLFPRDYKLYRQPSMLFDSTPTMYEVGITHTSSSAPYVKTEYHPVLARGPSNLTVTLGKGTFTDFFASNNGNVILVHGLMSSPTTFYFNENGQPNDDDLLLAFRNDPAFQNIARNVILYQYPSGWLVGTNAKTLMNLITTYAKPGFRTTIIAHSMGGIVARYALERLDLSTYTDKLITLGTPHEGGQLNYFIASFTGTHLGSLLSGGVIPSLNDIVSGSALLNDPRDGLNTQFPGKKGTTEYFLIAGKQSPSIGDDGLVTVGSATSTYLQVPVNQQIIFDNVEHSELHTKARTNGVLMKIREWVTGQPNRAPTVDAGVDQTVTVNTQVTLAGSATDADQDAIVSYAWSQTAGPTVTLANADTATATFTPTQTGAYTFRLTARDARDASTDTVTITVTPASVQTREFSATSTVCTSPQYPGINVVSLLWSLVAGGRSGTSFTSFVGFDNLTPTIPQTATISRAHLVLVTRSVWQSGQITLADSTQTITTFHTNTTRVDVTAYVQSRIAAGAQSLDFRLTSSNAYIEYEVKASGHDPWLDIEWQ